MMICKVGSFLVLVRHGSLGGVIMKMYLQLGFEVLQFDVAQAFSVSENNVCGGNLRDDAISIDFAACFQDRQLFIPAVRPHSREPIKRDKQIAEPPPSTAFPLGQV